MNKQELYGDGDSEHVCCETLDDCVDEILDRMHPEVPETVDVYRYETQEIPEDYLKGMLVHFALEYLDEEFGEPDGEPTKSSAELDAAELEFINVLIKHYGTPWTLKRCEKIEVNVEEWKKNNDEV